MAKGFKFKMTISRVKVNNATNNIKFKKSYFGKFGKDYKHDNEENPDGDSSKQIPRGLKKNCRNQ